MAAVWHLSSGYRRSTVIGVDDASAHLCAVQGIHGSQVECNSPVKYSEIEWSSRAQFRNWKWAYGESSRDGSNWPSSVGFGRKTP